MSAVVLSLDSSLREGVFFPGALVLIMLLLLLLVSVTDACLVVRHVHPHRGGRAAGGVVGRNTGRVTHGWEGRCGCGGT